MSDPGSTDFRHRYGPWALVAGASDGLGAEFATQLAHRGLNLILVARREEKLCELAAKLGAAHGIQVQVVALDLSCPDVADRLTDATRDKEVGLIVYNAALGPTRLFFDSPLEEHRAVLSTNCWGPVSLVYAFAPAMFTRRRGGIILLSSMSATQGSAYIAHYAATKAYNMVLAEGLWSEFAPQGVDVLVSMPAAVDTPNYRMSLGKDSKETAPTMSPAIVVGETLDALGKQPGIIPGFANRLQAFIMRRLLPRRLAVRLMSHVLTGMYRISGKQ